MKWFVFFCFISGASLLTIHTETEINSLKAKDDNTKVELHKCRIELGKYKKNASKL